jgi:tryptophan synthase alpha chain
MNRLDFKIKQAHASGKKLFCAFVTLGYPNLSFTEKLIIELEKKGTDILELGFPFSDPLADGPVIQEASNQALNNGIRIKDAFLLASRLRKKGVQIPLVFFTYYNPILSYGITRFVAHAKQNGFDAVLCPDLPVEEDQELSRTIKKAGLGQIYLIAPTSSNARIQKIGRASHPFIYYVSRRGVTGIRKSMDQDLSAKLKNLKRQVHKAVLVGFGVSSAKHVREIAKNSDGVIVGSAIVDWAKRLKSPARVAHQAQLLMKSLR